MSTHSAHVAWKRGDDIRAHTITVGEQAIAASAAVDFGGDGAKADPEGLLLAALASCHMLWFLDFARREHFRTASYEVAVEGSLDGDAFCSAVLRPTIEWDGEPPSPDLVTELHGKAHASCFIANSVNFPVKVEE